MKAMRMMTWTMTRKSGGLDPVTVGGMVSRVTLWLVVSVYVMRGQTSAALPEVTSTPEPEVTSEPETAVISEPESEVTSEPESELTSEPESEVTSEPESEVTSEPESEVTSEPESELTSEPESEVISEPESEVTSEPESEVTSEPESEVTSEPESEVTSEPESELTSEPESEVISEPESEVTSEPESEVTSEPESEVTSEPESEVTSEPESEVTSEPESEVTSEPESEVTSEPESEVTSEPESEVTSEPESEVTSEPESEVTSEPESEVTSEPESEVTSEPESEVTSEPESEVTSEPESEVTSEPESEVTSEPESEVTPEPISEVTPEPESEVTSEPASEVTSELESEGSSEPESEATSEPESEVTSEPESEVSTEPESEVSSEPESEATSEPESEATSEPESEATSEPESEVTSEPEAEMNATQPEPESEAADAEGRPSAAEIVIPPVLLMVAIIIALSVLLVKSRKASVHSTVFAVSKNFLDNVTTKNHRVSKNEVKVIDLTAINNEPPVHVVPTKEVEGFFTDFDVEVLHSLRNCYNQPKELIRIAMPALLSLALCPATLYMFDPFRKLMWPEDEYPSRPDINDAIACYLAPAGLVYATSFGFAFQQVLNKQHEILTKMTDEISMLDQIITFTIKLQLQLSTKLKILKAVKTECIFMALQVLDRDVQSYKMKPVDDIKVKIWTVVDLLREVDTSRKNHVDRVLTERIMNHIMRLNSITSDRMGVLHSRIHPFKWVFLETLGFFSFLGILLLSAYSYRMELCMCIVTVFSISMLCYVVSDLDAPFSGFFRVDIGVLEEVLRRLDLINEMAKNSGQIEMFYPE